MRITRLKSSAAGFSFIELLVATFVMLILGSAALPIVRVSIRRQKERDLHYALKEMRQAIDKFKDAADRQQIAQSELPSGSEGYPASLEVLIEGVAMANDATGRKLKFLRRIPIDPILGRAEWGLRSQQDASDSKAWGGQNVYNVYSKAEGKGLDGTTYREW
jgi:general secretion pathway protein G